MRTSLIVITLFLNSTPFLFYAADSLPHSLIKSAEPTSFPRHRPIQLPAAPPIAPRLLEPTDLQAPCVMHKYSENIIEYLNTNDSAMELPFEMRKKIAQELINNKIRTVNCDISTTAAFAGGTTASALFWPVGCIFLGCCTACGTAKTIYDCTHTDATHATQAAITQEYNLRSYAAAIPVARILVGAAGSTHNVPVGRPVRVHVQPASAPRSTTVPHTSAEEL